MEAGLPKPNGIPSAEGWGRAAVLEYCIAF